jgi:hypothetical protein
MRLQIARGGAGTDLVLADGQAHLLKPAALGVDPAVQLDLGLDQILEA